MTHIRLRVHCAVVDDAAAFGYRGAMVDAARDVLTLTQLKWVIVFAQSTLYGMIITWVKLI